MDQSIARIIVFASLAVPASTSDAAIIEYRMLIDGVEAADHVLTPGRMHELAIQARVTDNVLDNQINGGLLQSAFDLLSAPGSLNFASADGYFYANQEGVWDGEFHPDLTHNFPGMLGVSGYSVFEQMGAVNPGEFGQKATSIAVNTFATIFQGGFRYSGGATTLSLKVEVDEHLVAGLRDSNVVGTYPDNVIGSTVRIASDVAAFSAWPEPPPAEIEPPSVSTGPPLPPVPPDPPPVVLPDPATPPTIERDPFQPAPTLPPVVEPAPNVTPIIVETPPAVDPPVAVDPPGEPVPPTLPPERPEPPEIVVTPIDDAHAGDLIEVPQITTMPIRVDFWRNETGNFEPIDVSAIDAYIRPIELITIDGEWRVGYVNADLAISNNSYLWNTFTTDGAMPLVAAAGLVPATARAYGAPVLGAGVSPKTTVPEPSAAALASLALLGIAATASLRQRP